MSAEDLGILKAEMRQDMRDGILRVTPDGINLYRSGEPVTSRSLHLATAVVFDNLPRGFLVAADIREGFQKTFPNAEVITRPGEIHVDYYQSDRDPQLKKSYTAVNQDRSERDKSDTSQLLTVINGELVVIVWEGRNHYREYSLREAERFPIEQGTLFSTYAGKGWAIYHTSSYPRINEGRHHIAVPHFLRHVFPHHKDEKLIA